MPNHATPSDSKRPQPVLNTAAIVSVVKALATSLVVLGVVTPLYADRIGTAATIVLNVAAPVWVVVGPLVTAFIARRKVTPVATPKDTTGQDLVPAGSAAANVDVARELAAADAICPAVDPDPDPTPAAADTSTAVTARPPAEVHEVPATPAAG